MDADELEVVGVTISSGKSAALYGEVSRACALAQAVARDRNLELLDLSPHYGEDWRGLPGNQAVGDHLVSTRGTPAWILSALEATPKILFLPDILTAYEGMTSPMQSVIRTLLKDRRFPGHDHGLPPRTGVLAHIGVDQLLPADVANACARITLA